MDADTQTDTSTEDIDQREYRRAKIIFELYVFTRQEKREYLAKLEEKGVNKVTRDAIRKKVFRLPA